MDADSVDLIAVLGDGVRRRLFGFVRSSRRAVTRDEAAAAVGISRKLAAFHLDKLAAAGLVETSYGPPDGIRRVGRAPKLYRVSDLDLRVSIPARRHDLLAQILLDAITVGAPAARSASLEAARRRGVATGAAERAAVRPGRLGAERTLTIASRVLERGGFEPARESQLLLRLRNCPFHPFAESSRDLVCGLNQAFIAGVLDGLEAPRSVAADLAPEAGMCCVQLRAAG